MLTRLSIAAMPVVLSCGALAQDAAPVQPAAGEPAGPVASSYKDSAESIWPGIVRFYPSAEDKAKAPPSLIVQIPPVRFDAAPDNPPVVPKFSRDGERHVATIEIEPGTSLYGCGAVSGPLTLNGRVFVAAPADRDLAPPAEHAASLAVPWVLAVRPNGTAFGVLADTTWRTEIDLTTHIVLRADGPTLPVIVVDAATPMEPVQALSLIAGWQEIPPLWALGLHAGPTQFIPDGDLGDALGGIVSSWRGGGLPIDSIGVYWSRMGAAEPRVAPLRATVERLAGVNTRLWVMLVPSLSTADAPELHQEGSNQGHWILDSSGKPFELAMLPRGRVFPDLTRESTRAWWSRLHTSLLSSRIGSVAFPIERTDNPPLGTRAIPDHAMHAADAESGGAATHAKYRAIYNTLHARAARDALKSAFPHQRPFVQIGASSTISQRYGYQFIEAGPGASGVRSGIATLLNASMSGQTMLGVEISAADKGPEGSALGRALAVVTMLPMIRVVVPDRSFLDPASLSSDTLKLCRQSLERRSRLIPYLYTLALDAYRQGQPMMRPYFMGDPANAAVRDVTGTFLLGRDLAVRLRPRDGEEGGPVPEGWRRFDFGEESELLPELYLRPGAILPVGPVMQHTGEKPLDPLTLVVFLDAQGSANGVLYEDAGDGFEYLQNNCRMAYYQATVQDGEVVVKMARLDGAMGMAKRKLNVRLLLPDGREATAEYWDALDVRVKLP